MQQSFVGFILLALGGLYVVRPDLLLRFQVWIQKILLGAKYVPTKRTHKVIRYFGVFFVILGLLVLTGVIE